MMNRPFRLLTFCTLLFLEGACQVKEDKNLLLNLMKRDPARFQYFLDHKKELEIQIIYTQINRDANNVPVFKTFFFNVDSSRYFYPASTVKLPMVLIALEKLNQLKVPGLDKYSIMLSDSLYPGQKPATRDTTSETGMPSIAHYCKKILVVSDNDGYNRLYEFMGQKAANDILRQKGYHVRLLHRLERALTPDENRHTERIRFLTADSALIYEQPMLVGDSIPADRTVMKGVAYYKDDSLIHEPFNMSYKNFFPLPDQQQVLRALLFPGTVKPEKRFNISEEDRQFVLRYLSQLPTETAIPDYRSDTAYFPAYSKFLMYADLRDTIPASIRIFNKIGDAYGYLIDNAYIVDFDKKIEFMLSAVIFANSDGIFNDSNYEYKKIGYPFMRNLGQLIYQYEVKRKRERKPDLSEFEFDYGEYDVRTAR